MFIYNVSHTLFENANKVSPGAYKQTHLKVRKKKILILLLPFLISYYLW